MTIVNKVEMSDLLVVDLQTYYPHRQIFYLDIQAFLEDGLVAREKDIREKLLTFVWPAEYTYIGLYCSTEAIFPDFLYYLLGISGQQNGKRIFLAPTRTEGVLVYYQDWLEKLDLAPYKGRKVIVKGCGQLTIPLVVYWEFLRKIQPVVASLRVGEACASTLLFRA